MTDIVERLRELEQVEHELAHDCDYPPEATANWKYAETCREAAAEIERLRAALREAYEVYAGSDGFIPETAGEGYQQQIIRQMVDCISAALEGRT